MSEVLFKAAILIARERTQLVGDESDGLDKHLPSLNSAIW